MKEMSIREIAENKNKMEKEAQLVKAMQKLLLKREEQIKIHEQRMAIHDADEKLIEGGYCPSSYGEEMCKQECNVPLTN